MATETPEKPQDMRLRMLRTVEATHQHGTAVAAAQALHVSTSAVSRTIRLAEQSLQVPLFERGTRGMVCTAPGLAVVRACEAIRVELMSSVSEGAPQPRQVESLLRVLTVPLLRCFVTCAELANETLAARCGRLLRLTRGVLS